MYGRKYQWVIMGTYTEEWWLGSDGGCAPSELAEALQGAILTDLLPLSTERHVTISGIVSVVPLYLFKLTSFQPPYFTFLYFFLSFESRNFISQVDKQKVTQ